MNNKLRTLFATTAILLIGCSADEPVEEQVNEPVEEVTTYEQSNPIETNDLEGEVNERPVNNSISESLNSDESDNEFKNNSEKEEEVSKAKVTINGETFEVDDNYTETENEDGSISSSSSIDFGAIMDQQALDALEEDPTIPVLTEDELTEENVAGHARVILTNEDRTEFMLIENN